MSARLATFLRIIPLSKRYVSFVSNGIAWYDNYEDPE
jgi:hypothetical protein